MTKDKQIEEMASDLENHTCMSQYQAEIASRMLYIKGYRKASDVAREIFEELIDNATFIEYADGGRYLRFNAKFFAELKKKYTEGEE